VTVPRDISKSLAILTQAGFREWGDRELYYHCEQRVAFTRERIEHKDDNWVAEKVGEGNLGPDWRVHSDHGVSEAVLRAVEDRCRRPDWPPGRGEHANL
jgi:hypothetical protein